MPRVFLSKELLPDNIIMSLSDRLTVTRVNWSGNVYKILTEKGYVGYIFESNSVKLVFTVIS